MDVVVKSSWVVLKGISAELERVDKDAGDDSVILLPGCFEEYGVSVVKAAHGGNQADGVALGVCICRPSVHVGDRVDDLHGLC